MALIAEDGTGLSTANSAVTLDYANAYWTAHPSTAGAWATASDPQKEEALMVATADVLAADFKGSPLSGTQALPLPRFWPIIDGRSWGGMPTPLLNAVCEMAGKHLASALNSALKRGGEVASESVGPLSRSYFQGAPGGSTYPHVRKLIAPFLAAGSGQAFGVLSS